MLWVNYLDLGPTEVFRAPETPAEASVMAERSAATMSMKGIMPTNCLPSMMYQGSTCLDCERSPPDPFGCFCFSLL